MKITIFTTETCPRCKLLAKKLRGWGRTVEEKLMVEASTDEIADCRLDIGFWPMSAPLLQIEFGPLTTCWYADVSLFPGGSLDEGKLKAILSQGGDLIG